MLEASLSRSISMGHSVAGMLTAAECHPIPCVAACSYLFTEKVSYDLEASHSASVVMHLLE